jgi:hypothetical protein
VSGSRGGWYRVFRWALCWPVPTRPPCPHRGGDAGIVLCQLRGSVRRQRRGSAPRSGTERACVAGKGFALAFAVLARIGLDSLLDRGAAMFSQAVDQPGELVGRRRAGFGGSSPTAHPSREGPQSGVRLVDCARGEAPGHGHARRAGAHVS